jgi:hypothetical protein
MMKRILSYCLPLIGLLLTDCSRKMISLETGTKIGDFILQLDKVDIYLSKADVLQMTKNQIERERNKEVKDKLQDAYEIVERSDVGTLSFPLKLDTNAQNEIVKSSHLLVFLTYYDLLKDGRVKIYNKQSNNFESKVFYKRQKAGLGQRGEVFYLSDGMEFYYHVISLGE